MAKIYDMHCHVLPGVDDGPANLQDSLAVIREEARQGVEALIVTPHFHPGRYKVYAVQVRDGIEQLREALLHNGIRMELIPGQECYYYTGLVRELDAGRVLTMAGSRCVLVEFDPGAIYGVLQQAVRELTNAGYRPIIAHYERYKCLYGKAERLAELKAGGAMLQLNFDRLLEKDTFFRKNLWRKQLRDGEVDFLGSDTHGMGFRPPHIRQAVEWVRQEAGKEEAERILSWNIQGLIDNEL